MQLDQTHIVIRLRTLSEIADLALVAIRHYPSSIGIGFALGALPWAIANTALLAWIPIRESQFGFGDQDASLELFRYVMWMALLILSQTPAAGILTTYYLGQAVFEKRPTWRSVIQECRSHFWSWFWALGIRRLPIPIMVLLLLRWGQPFDGFFDSFVPFCLFFCIIVPRAGRPFFAEVLMLEQCPWRSKDANAITVRKRMRALHSPMSGELISRLFVVGSVLTVFVIATYYSLAWCRGIALGQWNVDLFAMLVMLPLAIWCLAGVSVIVRLLSYLDTRIRLEGWEVELAVRAEALRQFGDEPSPSLSGANQE